MAKGKSIDKCRARGCPGYLREVEAYVHDGDRAYCMTCRRGYTFHVPSEDVVYVVPDRKPRPVTGKIRGRGGKGGWVPR